MDTQFSPQSVNVGVIHPGKMGASIALALIKNGHKVFFALDERSEATKNRALPLEAVDLGSIENLCKNVEVIISICMGSGVLPNIEKVRESGFKGTYVDANHIEEDFFESKIQGMLSRFDISYVEAAIYGWPYPHENDPHGERTIYLSGEDASFTASLLDGEIFSTIVTELLSAKQTKKQREKQDRKNNKQMINHGNGIVEFENVINIDDDFIDSWMERLKLSEPDDYYLDEDGFYVNRGGYKFPKETIDESPKRFLKLLTEDSTEEEKLFVEKIDNAMFECIHAYIGEFPEAKDCLRWRSDGHIAYYPEGAGMGPHHDNAIGGASENENPLFNVVSGSLILSDRCTGGDLGFKNLGGKLFEPKKGSAIFYPSSYMGTHFVNNVTSGARVSFLEFFGHGAKVGQTRNI